jgi:hypothetical protein
MDGTDSFGNSSPNVSWPTSVEVLRRESRMTDRVSFWLEKKRSVYYIISLFFSSKGQRLQKGLQM